ncbi:MAG: methyltransferase domain-containing protein [Bdellovibrionota bacterium]
MNSSSLYFDRAAGSYAARSGRWPWSLLRRREEAAVLELLAPRAEERIADAACGAGHYAAILQGRGCDVVGIDRSPAMTGAAKDRGLTVLTAEITEAGFKKEFDAVVCAGGIEFNTDPVPLFKSFSKWLKPAGRLVLLYPGGAFRFAYETYHSWTGTPVTFHSGENLMEAAQGAGLRFVRGLTAGLLARAVLFEREALP